MLLPDDRPGPPAGVSWRRAAASSPRLLMAIVTCAAVLTGSAIWLAVSGGDSQTAPGTPDRPPGHGQPDPGAGASRTRQGVAVGYEHSRAGAVSAAVNYEMARTRPDYFTDEHVRRGVLGAMMSRESLAAQLASDNANADAAMARLGLQPGGTGPGGARFLARGAPLGTRVTSYSDQVATVDVWMAEVIGVIGENSSLPVQAAWTTYTVTLTWQDDDWKIASLTTKPGPVPVSGGQGPSSSMEWMTRLEGMDAPPPVS